jgi:hypothetical protein
MESRECFPLGRGLATLTPRTDPPTDMRPFGMRQAVTLAPATEGDISLVTYDPAAQMLTLVAPTGDPEQDLLTLAKETKTSRVTKRDARKPTTPDDFQTDKD